MNGNLLLNVVFGACLFFHAAAAQEGAFKNIYWKIYYHESLSNPEEIFYRPSLGEGETEKILEEDQVCVVFAKNRSFFSKLEEKSGAPSWPFRSFPYADNPQKNIAILDCGAHIIDLWVFQSFHPRGYVDSQSPALNLEDAIHRFMPEGFLKEYVSAVRSQVAAELLKHWFSTVSEVMDHVKSQLNLYVTSIEPFKEKKLEDFFKTYMSLAGENLSDYEKKDICLGHYYVDPHHETQKNNFIRDLEFIDRQSLVEQINVFENMRLNKDPASFSGLFVPHSMDMKVSNHMFAWMKAYVFQAGALSQLKEEFVQRRNLFDEVAAELDGIANASVEQYLQESLYRLQIKLKCHDLWVKK